MQKKRLNKFIFATAAFSSLLSIHTSYSVIAYMPVPLRECLANISEVSGKRKNGNFQELCAMIKENRILASDKLVRQALGEALDILKNNANFDRKWQDKATTYLENYLDNLDTSRSLVCSLKSDSDVSIKIPHNLFARAVDADSASKEMMYLSSELTHINNIELCGNTQINADFTNLFSSSKSVKPTNLESPSLIFNANMLTNSGSSFPNVIFGTGVSNPFINAWAMPSSLSAQSPINMQFSIPGNLQTEKAMSIEMHFLITKQNFADGDARIRIHGMYVNNNQELSEAVTHTTNSESFHIEEPSNSDGLLHLFIDVPIEKSDIEKRDFALISLSRIEPGETEYAGNIYLVAAAFKYTPVKP